MVDRAFSFGVCALFRFTVRMDPEADHMDLLTIAQLKQVADASPQPYRIQAQVDNVTEKQTQQGKPYFELRLADGSESLLWRVFDSNPAFDAVRQLPRSVAWVEIAAHWIDSGKYGLDAKNPAMRRLTDDEVRVLLEGDEETRMQNATDYGEIVSRIAAMADPRLKALCELFLERHGERFRRTAAAREYHHARRGGLVEHVAQMMRSAAAIASVYPRLNADLLIAGVLFHDCGKLWETAYADNSFSMPHHLSGEMLGHIPLGLELVNKLWRELMDKEESGAWLTLQPASDLVRLHLLHLIGSHHGEYQFGAPVLPKTPEAIVLHHVDNIDAKLEMLRRAYATSTELGAGIFERVRPLPQNIVEQLPRFIAPPSEAEAQCAP